MTKRKLTVVEETLKCVCICLHERESKTIKIKNSNCFFSSTQCTHFSQTPSALINSLDIQWGYRDEH